jgi:hypothetical protein
MQLIETIEVGSAVSSITFSSIDQTYKDLLVLVSVRTSDASVFGNVQIKPNGSTSNRSDIELIGNGATASSSSGTDGTISRAAGNSTNPDTFGNGRIYISNYSSSNFKSISAEGAGEANGTTALASIIAMSWNDTSAITSLEFVTSTGSNFLTDSTMSLYGIS